MSPNINERNMTAHSNFVESLQDTQEASQMTSTSIQAANEQDMKNDAKFENESEANPAVLLKKKDLHAKTKVQKIKEVKKVDESVLVRKEDADGLADQFSGRQGNRNYYLDYNYRPQLSRLAQEIGMDIHENADPDYIIDLVRNTMSVNGKVPTPAIIDKTFDFLLEAARAQFDKVEGADKKRLDIIYHKLETTKVQHFKKYEGQIEFGHATIDTISQLVRQDPNSKVKVTDAVDTCINIAAAKLENIKDGKDFSRKYGETALKQMLKEFGEAVKTIFDDNPYLSKCMQGIKVIQAYFGVEPVIKRGMDIHIEGIIEAAAAA